jgi:hypothetical protein
MLRMKCREGVSKIVTYKYIHRDLLIREEFIPDMTPKNNVDSDKYMSIWLFRLSLLVGEVSINFSGERVLRDQRNETPRPLISVF